MALPPYGRRLLPDMMERCGAARNSYLYPLEECVEGAFSEVRVFAFARAGIVTFVTNLFALDKDGAFGGYDAGGFVAIVASVPGRTRPGERGAGDASPGVGQGADGPDTQRGRKQPPGVPLGQGWRAREGCLAQGRGRPERGGVHVVVQVNDSVLRDLAVPRRPGRSSLGPRAS